MRCVCSGAGRRRTRASDGAQRSDWRSDWLSGRGMIRERERVPPGEDAPRGWVDGWMAALAVWLSGLCLAVPLVSPGAARRSEHAGDAGAACSQSVPPEPHQRPRSESSASAPHRRLLPCHPRHAGHPGLTHKVHTYPDHHHATSCTPAVSSHAALPPPSTPPS